MLLYFLACVDYTKKKKKYKNNVKIQMFSLCKLILISSGTPLSQLKSYFLPSPTPGRNTVKPKC